LANARLAGDARRTHPIAIATVLVIRLQIPAESKSVFSAQTLSRGAGSIVGRLAARFVPGTRLHFSTAAKDYDADQNADAKSDGSFHF
jgi:hypothetical protein